METDIYKNFINKQADDKVMRNVALEILRGDISPDLKKCLITYELIEHHVEELKKKNRGSEPLLEKGIESFRNGSIVLFNGELFSYTEYKIQPYVIFLPLRDKLLFNINGMKKTNWKKVGQDEYEYVFSSVLAELKFILVTAQIMYELLINKKEKNLTNDEKLMPLITQTYVEFFKKAIGRLGSSADPAEWDKLNYVLSKFFYVHSLGFGEQEADKVVSKMYNYEEFEITDIKLSEESIDYTNLSTFVPTMTKLFYKKEIDIGNLVNAWHTSFGETMLTEAEYFPTLLTHILVLIFGVEFVNQKYDLKSRSSAIYQRLTVALK
jgi:hypothetical protein